MSDIIEKIKSARLKLITERPYFTHALFALNMKKGDDKVDSLGVDKKWNLYYNSSFTEELPREHLETILVHEIMHLLRKHFVRAKAIDAKRKIWNFAVDAEINDDLSSDGMVIPDWFIFAKDFKTINFPEGMPDNMLGEEYYVELINFKNDIENLLPKDLLPGQGNCGSAAHGEQESWEEDMEEGGLTDGEAELIRRQVAEDVKKYSGNIPGYLQRWADEMLGPPKVDWRKELFSNIKNCIDDWKAGSADYTFSKRNKRYHSSNIVFPSMFDSNPRIAVVIDTSGSIGKEDLKSFLSEISGILSTIGHDSIRVLACDAEVHEDIAIKDVRDLKEKIVGGGGTDMGAAIDYLEKDSTKPHICVVLTDGYTPWPEVESSFSTIAVITTDQSVPSWIKPIWLDGYVRN